MSMSIAAMAESGRKLVVRFDHAFSFKDGLDATINVHSTDIHRILPLSTSSDLMFVGEPSRAYRIWQLAERRVQKESLSVARDTAEIVRQAYRDTRQALLVESLLEPRGLTLKTFLQGQLVLDPTLVREIDRGLMAFNLDVDLLISGVDGKGRHLFRIMHPGTLHDLDVLGVACIGPDCTHIINKLIREGYKRSLKVDRVKDLVETACKNSERDSGKEYGRQMLVLPDDRDS